jgi:splicing factor 3B subunit 4
VSVYIPRDKLTKEHNRFGFVEFQSESDVDYACKVMNGVPLYNQPLRVNRSGRDRKLFDIGANLFIGNLDPEVDDRHLTETFKHFGNMIGPAKVARDDTSGASRGYAFIYYDSFEAADAAIAAMNGQFFGGRRINVNFSFKKDKPGERHGDTAERMLAAKNPLAKVRQEIQASAAAMSIPSGPPPPFNMGHPPGSGSPPFVPGPFGSPPPFIPGQTAPAFGFPPPPGMYGMPTGQHYQQSPNTPMQYPPPQYPPQPYGHYPR